MDGSGERLKRLSREKLASFLQKTKTFDDKAPQPLIARRESVSNVFPLSFAQQAIWFLEQLNPGTPAYNLSLSYLAIGKLDVPVLRRCFDEIVRRHEALRTTFRTEANGPVQVVSAPESFQLRLVDLREQPLPAREQEARRLAHEDSQRPFDLACDPLLRISLLRMDELQHVIVITMHHIVFDAWSIGVLFREVQVLYEAFSQGKPSPLPHLPFQYPDFAVWQRQTMQDETRGDSLAYWKRKLTPPPETLKLPTDRPRPRRQTFYGGHQSIALSPETYAALKAVAEQVGATISMALMAAFKVLLHRYSGQESFCVGVPILGRNNSQLEQLIGHFVNTLVMMTDLSGNPTFQELLRRVRQTNLDAYSHQDLPFEKLVEELQLQRDSSHTPLFQVLFNFLNATHVRNANFSGLPGLTLDTFESLETGSAFDLSLIIFARREGGVESANLVFEYNAHLFDAATINRMLRSLHTIIESAIEDPNHRLSELALLSDTEHRQLLIEWNDTAKDFSLDVCIHRMFEEQVERTPDALAVAFQDQRVSYRELNARANELAHRLISSGIGKGAFVPLLIDRGVEFVVGILAIMKTGAAFVPLDVHWPVLFLKQCLANLSLPLLTTRDTATLVPEHPHLILNAQDDWTNISNPRVDVNSADDIYAIYTSGSTGTPKAAIVRHRGITNRFLWMNEFLGAERAITLQTTRPIYDSAVWQICWPLINGGVTILPVHGREADADYLTKLIAEHGVTVADFVPSVFSQLVPELINNHESRASWQSLRWLVLGGEEISTATTHTFMNCFPNVRAVNLYGPTEASIGCIYYEVTGAEDGRIPIGKPIANTKVFILDQERNPVPPLVTGEIYLSGVCLGRGYLNDPQSTERVFVQNVFAEVEGPYLYRTGDLGRYRSDGNIEFLGRSDPQVKLRGIRIEPGEIETVLARQSAVRDCVVTVHTDAGGEKRLVAFVVLHHDSIVGSSELRDFLRERLPEHMVPQHFTILDALPLTPGGKINKQALPDPDWMNPDVNRSLTRPHGPYEQIILEIWAEVIGNDELSVYDNFFSLGGHSLLATQVISRIRRSFQVDVPLRYLFEAPTVAELATFVEENVKQSRNVVIPPLERTAQETPPPLSFAQQRLWFLNQLEPESPAYNLATAVRLQGQLNADILQCSFNRVIERHDSLRTTFGFRDLTPVQFIASQLELKVSLADLTALEVAQREAEVRRIVNSAAQEPFNLSEGPLIRVSLLRLGPVEHVLLFAMQHIVSDGWSMEILIRELVTIYDALLHGREPQLPELEIQYSDYSLWQHRWLQGETLDNLLAYWRQQLTAAPPLLDLPLDRPRPSLPGAAGGQSFLTLPSSLVQALKRLGQQEGVTLFVVLLAGFKSLLQRYTRSSDIVVGSPIANRNHVELESLIGFFVNTLVLRTDLSGNPSFREVLRREKEVVLEACAHQDLPYEKLVEELKPARSLSHNPLFQVLFVWQNTATSLIELPDLSLTRLDVERKSAKFDLSLYVTETTGDFLCSLEFNADLFEPQTATRMLEHWRNLLEGVVAAPDGPVSEPSLVSAAELTQIVESFNDTARAYETGVSLHQLFERQVEHTPDAVAAVFHEQKLTYRELNQRANQVARHLLRLGLRTEELVAICMERSLDLIIALLGIMKTGCAYVPLDPSYPKERLHFMLKDAQLRIALTQERLAKELFPDDITLLNLDTEWPAIAIEETTDLACRSTEDNLAYVIYTSGSTGRPKGVLNTHRGICNRLIWMQEQYQLNQTDCVLQKTSLSFDVSVWEFFCPLISGARLIIARPQGEKDSSYLTSVINEHAVTTVHFVPSMLQEFLEHGRPEECPSLRRVICSGETLPAELVRRFHQISRAELHNLYGPTEAAIDVTHWHCPTEGEFHVTPIGKPIANTQIFVLDGNGQVTPIGIPGELHIAGAGLARGYWDRPDLTAEKFVPNPFARQPGERMYRTGDLARYLPNGQLEFLDRLDNQVKIRGFRIELAEVENALHERREIKSAVVNVRERPDGNRQLVAYLVRESGRTISSQALRNSLRRTLPEYMIPSLFVTIDELPLMPNGKIDRRALAKVSLPQPEGETSYMAPQNDLERKIASTWQEALLIDKPSVIENFFDLGGHSLLLARVQRKLQEMLNVDLTIVQLFQYPTIRSLAEFLKQNGAVSTSKIFENQQRKIMSPTDRDVAVIGMSLRLPGARNLDEFWQNLRDGVESISFFSREEALAEGAPPELIDDPNYVRASGVLDDIDMFDAAFFGFNPREAEIMDPQQRVFLECAFEALESAGYNTEKSRLPVGIFSGAGVNTYQFNLYTRRDLIKSAGGFQVMLGNDKDYLTTRVSYKLRLNGPSVTVQTACSTSLVAVHLACQSLLNGECSMALAGGVSIRTRQKSGYIYQAEGINSPDGHCRAFDAQAQGTVGGNGAGIVVLKRLKDALADGDSIYAVIKGTAINNDGGTKVGYTAPSVEGQANVIRAAQAIAGVTPETITYVEAHGTGTQLGDPIEIEALTQAFRSGTLAKGFCALGSVKTNIGHLDTAAGVAGLIKTILAFKHKQIPPSLHFNHPNPHINFAESPFYVNNVLREWRVQNDGPRRAGVSSFGIGGTNAHVIVEEAPPRVESDHGREWQVLFLSARSETALETATSNLAEYLKHCPRINLADVAYTLHTGRRVFNHRRAVICRDVPEAIRILTTREELRVKTRVESQQDRKVVMAFPGQGAQYVRMAHDLYEREAGFRTCIENSFDLLEPQLRDALLECLYIAADAGDKEVERAREQLQQTQLAQLALFIVEYALAQMWMKWGVQPQAMIGHSIGEYVAACLADVFSLEEALRVVSIRGALMQQLPPGAMLAVNLPQDKAQEYLLPPLSMAAVNGPRQCVISGPTMHIEQLQRSLEQKDIVSQRLRTSHAFHSSMIESIQQKFGEELRRITLRPPQIPYVSNVTGDWIKAEEATSREYWVRHMRETVHFGCGLETLLKQPDSILLEVGPGQTLGALGRHQLNGNNGTLVLSSLRQEHEQQTDDLYLARTVGQLLLAGVDFNWKGFYDGQKRRRCVLPTYPFERKRYWIDPDAGAQRLAVETKRDPENWFYLPSWKRSLPPSYVEAKESAPSCWLVLLGQWSGGAQLSELLEAGGHEVVRVKAGAAFRQDGPRQFKVRPSECEDYRLLFKELRAHGLIPRRIAHFWSLDVELETESFEQAQDYGFHSLIALAQALSAQQDAERAELIVATSGTQRVNSEERLSPENATILGPCKVIPQEYPHLTCRVLDVSFSTREHQLIKQLLTELTARSSDSLVAYRGEDRWVQTYEAVALRPSGTVQLPRLKERGVYLITGGIGRIGLSVALYLAKAARAQLVLTGLTTLPARENWGDWLANHDRTDKISSRLEQLLELEEHGASVLVTQVDVSDETAMRALMAQTRERFGELHGVIHAAGIAGAAAFHALSETQRDWADKQFRAKAHGLYVLEKVLAECELDFCILFSSLSSVLGGLGHATYSAANLFMDVFVQRHNLENSHPWTSVNWDAWNFDPQQNGTSIDQNDGIEILKRLWSMDPITQIVVSTRDLQGRINKWTNASSSVVEKPAPAAALPLHPLPSRRSNYVAARDDVERLVVQLWQELLGIQLIGVHDDFFDFGGHSLLATQLISRIRERFHINVALRSFFEAPTPAALTQLLKSESNGSSLPLLRRHSGRDRFPLSLSQQRLWFIEQFEPGNTLYHIPLAMRLQGQLSVAALEKAFRVLIARHETLRTAFAVIDDEPRQIVSATFSFALQLKDLRDLPEQEREATAITLASHYTQEPFDFTQPPLLRASLLQLAAREHILTIVMHHMISDGWSVGVMMHELSVAYEAAARGMAAELKELPIQYGDYAVWQREWLSGATQEKLLHYWRKRLSGLRLLELPADYVRPPVQTFHGAREPFALPPDLTAALRNLNRQEGVTLFVLLLAGFAALLARYAGQDEIVVGTSSAGRNSREHEALIGFFANTLVLRIDASGDPSFRTLLTNSRETVLDAYAHQDLPFEKLTEELQPDRDLSRTPLFQVMFELQNTPTQPALQLPGLEVSMVQLPSRTTKFDLTLSVFEGAETLMGSIEYNTALFAPDTIKRMAGHYQTLLSSAIADPDQRVSELSLLSASERKQLLIEWNDTAASYPRRDQCIHHLIEEQVKRTPEASAAVFEDQRLTYRELNAWSNTLAAQLLERGFGKGSYLPILMDRSLELVVSLLAVMKAGAAFVPIDVAWPQQRILRILESLESGLVLTDEAARAQAETLERETFVVQRAEMIAATPDPNVSIKPEDTMYVMYTSGSTGRPKGVVVPHRGITNRFLWMDEYFGSNTAASALQTTRHVYDSAVWQFFWPLINGGQTVIPSPSQPLDAEYLAALVEQHQVTILDFVPSVFKRMIPHFVENDEAKHKLRSVDTVIIGGEEISPAPTFKFVQHFPQVRLINLYGPTEASIGCVCYEVKDASAGRIPIGKPIANVKTLILDGHGNLVPVGVPGELYLTGDCLSDGYLGDEMKTRAAFVKQPFNEIHYDRLYKTGDRARHLSDGNIEFLGRIDNQVKIRGYRIELGEIETALGQLADVAEAVVVAREKPDGEKYLMAYVVARDGHTLSTSELRRYLQQQIPEYMAPVAYMQLESLPLLPNGKVDHRALPPPREERPDVDSEYVNPRTMVEQVITNIWADVLHLDQVGIHDDFFELGGHSLLATQVISRVRSVFHLELSLRGFFESPTVFGLAQAVESARCSKQGARVNLIKALERNGGAPLALSQVPLWEFEQLVPGASFVNLSSTARLRGTLNRPALETAFQILIARHETLRTSFVAGPQQIVSPKVPFALQFNDLRGLPETERNQAALTLASQCMQEPFDFARPPLLRALLVQVDDDEHVLAIVMHHIISDGWSIGVLTHELGVAYESVSRGVDPALEPLPVQYGDYAVWQRKWLSGTVVEQQLQYWRRQLCDLKQWQLPTDHVRPPVQTFSTSSQSLVLSQPLGTALKKLARAEGCTTFMVLLSALKILLYQYTRETDIRIGTLVANRNRKEIEGLIGLFVNTLILRTRISGNPSFRDFLRQLREVTMDACDHQDVPFELVVKDLERELQIDRGSLFSVLFILQNTPTDNVPLPGLEVLPLHTGGQALGTDLVFTTFDLIWIVLEGSQTLSVVLRYKTRLFKVEMIRQILERFQRILENAVAQPNSPIAELE